MKRTLLATVIVIVISTLSYAQEDNFGFKAGLNLTTIKFTESDVSVTPDRATKLHFGIYWNRVIAGNFSIQPEFLYHAIGYKVEEDAPIDNLTLSYLAMPVMVKYYANKQFNIHAGPQFGVLLGGTSFNGVSITEGTKSTEMALALGAEVNLGGNVGFLARYVAGISNTDDFDREDSDDLDFEQKSNTIQLSIVVRLKRQ